MSVAWVRLVRPGSPYGWSHSLGPHWHAGPRSGAAATRPDLLPLAFMVVQPARRSDTRPW